LEPGKKGAAVFVEPHSDDAALAAGHLIKRGVLGKKVVILTLFGRSILLTRGAFPFFPRHLIDALRLGIRDTFAHLNTPHTTEKNTCLCPYHAITQPDCAGIRYRGNLVGYLLLSLFTNIRRAEDDDFANFAGASRLDLGLLDHKFRVDAVGTGVRDPLAGRLGRVAGCTLNMLERLEPKVTLLVARWPYGKRVHPHHDFSFRLSCELSRTLEVPLYLVDDIPYTRRPQDREFINELTGARYRATVYSMTKKDFEDKIRMVRVFRSQPVGPYLDFLAKPLPGDDRPSETLWVPQETPS